MITAVSPAGALAAPLAPTMLDRERQLAQLETELHARLRGRVKPHEAMRDHTTFHIGGPADLLALPLDVEDLVAAIRFAREKSLPVKVIGNGSNLLVGDGGLRGLVVRLAPNFKQTDWREDGVRVGAGARLGKLLKDAAEIGLSGLESLIGIPGTLGGALATNAGTDTGSVSDLVVSATVVDEFGTIRRFDACDFAYRYRHSCLKGGDLVVVEADLRLAPAPPDDIRAKMARLHAKRAGRQPLTSWSAGCCFKNPLGVAAGKVLERAGAKGMRIGDAEVSRKHANFMINRGRASAAEMKELIARAHDLAWRRYEIDLELEIETVGD